MPSVMSASRPAALRRGPATKPRSKAVALARRRGRRPRTARRRPGARGRRGCARRPCATRMRLLRSSRTTSATVPSATRSSSAREVGLRRGVERAARRAAPRASRAARRTSRRRRRGASSGSAQPGWFGLTISAGAGSAVAGQVMVGDEHVDAERRRRGHAVDARDAVVDGHDQAAARCRARARRSPA